MQIEFDPRKQVLTHALRGLDFNRAPEVFSGPNYHEADNRKDYGEERTVTFGVLDDRMVVIVWTARGESRRIISMRYANEREISENKFRLG